MRKRESKTASGALLVDTAEAGRLLGVGRSTIVNLTHEGSLTPIRLGRSVRYSTDQLSEFVTQRRRSASRSESRAAEAGIYRLNPGTPDDVA